MTNIPAYGIAQELLVLVNEARQDEFLEMDAVSGSHFGAMWIPIGEEYQILYLRLRADDERYYSIASYEVIQ